MTVWRFSVENLGGASHDLIVESEENATVGDFWDELSRRGFDRNGLRLGTTPPLDETPLDQSPLLNGVHLGRNLQPQSTGPGWYLVTVAGPDTGSWQVIGPSPLVVGRGVECDLQVEDSTLSTRHFQIQLGDGAVSVEDLQSTNGTTIEGQQLAGSVSVTDGSYVHAGSSTFGVVRVDPGDLPGRPPNEGSTRPFQQRFRKALADLPASLKHPMEPAERSEANRRPLISFAIPIITAVGMATITGRYIFLLIIAIGPVFYALDGVRRRRAQDEEEATKKATYERQLEAMLVDLRQHRTEELRRDRWAAMPAGLAALLSSLGHQRLWERRSTDADFCEVAIGLYDAPSEIEVEGRPDDAVLPFDRHWSAVLRHSFVTEGPLAVKGPMDRARALGRALLVDLACSHSPNDLKIWLLTDSDASSAWNAARWLPHTYFGQSQNRIFASRQAYAGALSQLRSIITQRQQTEDRQQQTYLPVHFIVIDCLAHLDGDEVTDLLVDGASVGVVGLVLDPTVTPSGVTAELLLGGFSDQASFQSRTQPASDGVQSFEMSATRFDETARALAGWRPSGSGREERADTGTIRLVDLVAAETSVDKADRVAARWAQNGPTIRVKIGGLGELDTEIDLMRDGPHGLVAGTTRSGKTEFLKSLFTALAVANHPDDLSIVIVDFKGGVDHQLSARLPHVVDLSTNLNVASFVRTVKLLEAELLRRQSLCTSVGAPNFDAYHAARAKDPQVQALPRLLVVIDEFSEMLSSEEGKENLPALESIAKVGGGLGVHLLLVTQNFESQLPTQIAANAGLRICFRVQKAEHSRAVLDSDEAATIPKERIGRAFLRSHGGPAVEFQGARVAGPLPGHQQVSNLVTARAAPFSTVADAPPEQILPDVPAEQTDMWAVVDSIRAAAELTGWRESSVPWPEALPAELPIGHIVNSAPDCEWPVALSDEPDLQRAVAVGLKTFGPSIILAGDGEAGLPEVLRSMVTAAALRRGPDRFHSYVIDLLGQGFLPLVALPQVGGVAERNDALAMRIVRHVATEVGRRKSKLAEIGLSGVSELGDPAQYGFSDLVLFINGADRLVGQADSEASPMLSPIINLLTESVGTGVRLVLAGAPNMVNRRLGASVGRRIVFRCADPQVYGALGVPREFHGALTVAGRAFDLNNGRLLQFGVLPVRPDAPAAEIIRAVGQKLEASWSGPADLCPKSLRELPWPLPLRAVESDGPGPEVRQPVALAVDIEQGVTNWLDAEEDGPVFVVTGSTRSGRSTALLSAASLMSARGWSVVGLPASRRSPLSSNKFPGRLIQGDDVASLNDGTEPTALFVDDIHKWSGDGSVLADFSKGQDRCLVVAGALEFFGTRNDFTRAVSFRSALLLCPRSRRDATAFGAQQLPPGSLAETRPGRGVLVVAGEVFDAQVPFVEVV